MAKFLPVSIRAWALPWLEKIKANPAFFFREALFWCFWLSLALFPIGYGFREVMPVLCAIFLFGYYRCAWHESALARLGPLKWLFVSAAAMIVLGVIFSIHPFSSFLHVGTGINKAYILPFIAMECARGLRDLRRLCWALVFACFWEGLDGVWQAYTGYDFILGYTYQGRLTGSLGDYWVGNYLALAMVPAFGCWAILRQSLSSASVALLFCALFWPAVFLFLGASSRSGILALSGALFLWALMKHGWRHWLWLGLPCIAITIFLLFEGYRFSPHAVLDDNRWDLWRLAWQVFLAHPWFGAGAGQYNAAFQALDLAPAREAITISHPHDIYLELLCSHGIVGFCLGMTFLLGMAYWLLRRVHPHIRHSCADCDTALYWTLTAWFALGYVAWLINGIFGHDFYRIWWLAQAMCSLGVAIGAILSATPAKTK